MTIKNEADLVAMRRIGRLCGEIRDLMCAAAEPGMTTAELDNIGRGMLDAAGAISAPEGEYDFPGATCISVNEVIAHGIPGSRVMQTGDLINVDVSASLNGYFADTGASFVLGGFETREPEIKKLCEDGRKAMMRAIRTVRHGTPLREIGLTVENFARKNGYSLIRNLASHGVGRSLHEEPGTIATWDDPRERRTLKKGQVITIEPFLSMGSEWAIEDKDDGWTLYADTGAPTVQYEHSIVVTAKGYEILT